MIILLVISVIIQIKQPRKKYIIRRLIFNDLEVGVKLLEICCFSFVAEIAEMIPKKSILSSCLNKYTLLTKCENKNTSFYFTLLTYFT